jgi:hypothetical protein
MDPDGFRRYAALMASGQLDTGMVMQDIKEIYPPRPEQPRISQLEAVYDFHAGT